MSLRARVALVLAVAAVGGAGTMVVELAAVRLIAPWFGTSLVVWTNVIAVVLLALALGYLVGGKLSRSGRPLGRLGWMLVVAGALTAWLPGLSAPAARAFLPPDLSLHEAAGAVLWGSLAVSLVLFLLPAALLGTVAPLAVEAVQELEGGTAGHAGGAVLCASTLGSLAGVFGTSHLLLPKLGLVGTFLVASAALLGAGVGGLILARGPTRRSLVPLVIGGATWLAVGLGGGAERPVLPEGRRELAYAESPYQSVRVVEDVSSTPPLRYLQVNEGFDSFQSVWQPDPGLLPEGFYYNDFVLPPMWAGARGRWSVLVLGLGAGTAVRVIEGALPEGIDLRTVGVELDPVVIALAGEYLGLTAGGAHRVLDELDARVALRVNRERFDQVVLDCYTNQVEIPPHLCTREFFGELRETLVQGGWLSANIGGFGFDDPVVAAVARTCAEAFGAPVLLLRVPRARNFTLVARRDAELPLETAADGRARLVPLPGAVGELLAARELPGAWTLVEPGAGARILTDDRCPIERLQVESIRAGRARLLGGAGG